MAAFGIGLLGFAALVGLGLWGLLSLREGELRAARAAFGTAVLASLPFFLCTLAPIHAQLVMLAIVAAAGIATLFLFLLPIGKAERGNDVPQKRFDERDIMFARAWLEPGSPNYQAYYASRPRRRASDDRTRSLPGLLSLEASEANPLVFASTEAAFALIDQMQDAVDGPVAFERSEFEPSVMRAYVKGVTRYLGAQAVGITEVRPYHVYTHIGRGRGKYGTPVELEHRYAIAFTVEMDARMVGTAPAAPTLLESARQYARVAEIAIQLGNFIRSQGFPARAHIDANYRVIAPLVARDAGLGDFGRMGLLMTPTLGPRVRLGVVTTDLPLVPDQPCGDTSVLDYCRLCKKCAANCPVRAIPFGDREEIDGALRWRIDDEVCFRYWSVTGTDCARCVAVCPYSHPGSIVHNVVRWAVRRSGFARRASVWLDDIFYGSAPAARPAPPWVPPKPRTRAVQPSGRVWGMETDATSGKR